MSPLVRSELVRREARAVAEALFADERGAPPSARLDWLEAELADFLSHVGGGARASFYGALGALCLLAPIAARSPRRLSRMSLAERTEALSQVEGGPAAGLVLAVKAVLCILYYEHPEAAREVGFDGACKVAPEQAEVQT